MTSQFRIEGHISHPNWRYIKISHLDRHREWVLDLSVPVRGADEFAKSMIDLLQRDIYPLRIDVKIADRESESHYNPVTFEIEGRNVLVTYEGSGYFLSKPVILEGCQKYIEARYYAMYI